MKAFLLAKCIIASGHTANYTSFPRVSSLLAAARNPGPTLLVVGTFMLRKTHRFISQRKSAPISVGQGLLDDVLRHQFHLLRNVASVFLVEECSYTSGGA
ncbi:hypothetical protein BD309DRAFT_965079 [Dichomitus squalens]|nr:hypothetical protein BD309DRAFT_965079 [Dichomitus squalens]